MMLPVHASASSIQVPEGVADRIGRMGEEIEKLAARQEELSRLAGLGGEANLTRLEVFQGYIGVLIVAFVVTLLVTPIVRRLAVSNGIIDRPSDSRKVHRIPIAYMGGLAVYLGIMAGLMFSYASVVFPGIIQYHAISPEHADLAGQPWMVPPSIILGLTVIMLVGLIDDIVGVDPRVKIGGQLFAAAALAVGDVGVRVAEGIIMPVVRHLHLNTIVVDGGRETFGFIIPFGGEIPIMGTSLQIDVIYWAGTAIIALFVLGGCNASNLIDGLDGLLTGVTSIAAIGLLVVALGLAVIDDGDRDAQRIILCMALLGGCLGFLPHNFNPANIFLGDCGSLLLGYVTIVIILMLGDTGKTYLVLAGLVIYSIPIIDTALAIVRRKLAGKRMSDPDSDHLHHMLKRALGVKGAVLVLYSFGVCFAIIGIAMSEWRARIVYGIAMLLASYIAVYSIKIARRKSIEEQALAFDKAKTPPAKPKPDPKTAGTA